MNSQPAKVSVTDVIVGINVLVFLLMCVKGVPWVNPTGAQLLPWGANFGPLTLGGQPWRLLTANYLHFGVIHIATNMWCLLGLGKLAEVFYSRRDYILLYTVTGICGSLLSVYFHPWAVGAGASGAVFGVAGVLLTTLRFGHLPITDESRRAVYKSVLQFAGINLLVGFALPGIDNFGHMGGLISGGVIGLVLGRKLDDSSESRRFRSVAWLGILGALVFVTMSAFHSRNRVPPIYAMEQAFEQRKFELAIAEANAYSKKFPTDAAGETLRGRALLALTRFDEAAAAFQKGLNITPDDTETLFLQAEVYQTAGKFTQAEADLRHIVALVPNNPAAQYLLGVCLLREGKYPESEKLLDNATKLNASNPEFFLKLGEAQLAQKKFIEAIQTFEAAERLHGNALVVQQGLLAANQGLGNLNAAEEAHEALKKMQAQPKPQ